MKTNQFILLISATAGLLFASAPLGLAVDVISTNPVDTENAVMITTEVTATFSQEMDGATIDSETFVLKLGSTPIPGLVSYANSIATFSPTEKLKTNTIYNVTVTTGVTDSLGVALENDYVWTFTTGEPPPTRGLIYSKSHTPFKHPPHSRGKAPTHDSLGQRPRNLSHHTSEG